MRRLREAVDGHFLMIPVLLALAGAVAAGLLLAVGALMEEASLPAVLRFGEQNARSLLSAVAGGLLTVVVLVFWVRMVAVQMASAMFSARTMQGFLRDRFQQLTMGTTIGALVYTMVVLQAVPDGEAGMTNVPHLAVAGSLLVTVAVAVLVVATVGEGARHSRTDALVRRIADQVIEQVRATHPERGSVHGASLIDLGSPDPPDRPSHLVTAGDSGWIQRLDEDRLLAALPPGAVAEMQVRVGQFLTAGTPLCRVWVGESGDPDRPPAPGVELDADVDEHVRAAVIAGDGRTLEQDVAFGLQLLSDVAERALAPATGDTSAAEQGIMRIGVVMAELLGRDLPAPTREDDQRRMLLRPHELTPSDFVGMAFDGVRQADSSWPSVARAQLNTLAMLRDEVRQLGREPWVAPLERQAALIVDGAEHSTMLHADYREVRDIAERLELIAPGDPARRNAGDGAGVAADRTGPRSP